MNYKDINSERQFKDTTGKSKSEFTSLLSDYKKTYLEEHGQTYESYIVENVTEEPKLKTLEAGLFFVLFQLKNDMIWGSLGFVFGMAGSTARENFIFFSKLLEQTLEKKSDA